MPGLARGAWNWVLAWERGEGAMEVILQATLGIQFLPVLGFCHALVVN